MDARGLFTAIGAGMTSFLLVAVAVIELLEFEFSAIIGLPVGLLVGSVVAIGLWLRGDELGRGTRRVATACATFGWATLAFLALRYVNVGRGVLTLEVIVGASLAVVVIAWIALFVHDRDRS
jgi:hypothetical protein